MFVGQYRKKRRDVRISRETSKVEERQTIRTHRANPIAQVHQLLVIALLTNHLPSRFFFFAVEPLVRLSRGARETGIRLPVFQRRQRFRLLLFRQTMMMFSDIAFLVVFFACRIITVRLLAGDRVVRDDLVFDRFQRILLRGRERGFFGRRGGRQRGVHPLQSALFLVEKS